MVSTEGSKVEGSTAGLYQILSLYHTLTFDQESSAQS